MGAPAPVPSTQSLGPTPQPPCISLLECEPLESGHCCSARFTVRDPDPVGAQSVEEVLSQPPALPQLRKDRSSQRSVEPLPALSLCEPISSPGV